MGHRKKEKGKQQYTDSANLYNLDNTHLAKSISAKPWKDSGYVGTPSAPAFRLGKQQ